MPLDPMIANPVGVKLNDPLAQYNNYLLAAGRKGEMDKVRRAEKTRNALAEGYRLHTNERGETDFNALRHYAAKNLLGDAIPGMLDEEGKRAKTRAEVGETEAGTKYKSAQAAHEGVKMDETRMSAFKQGYENYKTRLDGASTPEHLEAWTVGMFSDPVLGPILRERGDTPEKALAVLRETLKTVPLGQVLMDLNLGRKDASENVITQSDLGGTNRISATNKYGDPVNKTLRVDNVTESPKAPRTIVNNNIAVDAAAKGADEFSKTVMKGRGDQFLALENIVNSAQQSIANIDRTLKVLDEGNVITGAGGDAKLNAIRYAKALGFNVDDDTVVNTELLHKQLANSVLERIGALRSQGIVLTPMSNLDIQKIEDAGPNKRMDAATLKTLLRIEREATQSAIGRYRDLRQRLQTGGMTGETMRTYTDTPIPEIPPAPGAQMKGTNGIVIQREAADLLRKRPELRDKFDKTYGPGSADRVLGGK